MTLYSLERVGGKDVYVVPVHQCALEAWAHVRRQTSTAFTVLSLDHHSDCNVMLALYGNIREPRYKEKLADFLGKYRYYDDEAMISAACEIQGNEQLDAGVKMGILSRALVICLELGCSEAEPDRRIFAVEAKRPNSSPTRHLVDQVLETAVLRASLSRLRELAPAQ